MLGQIELVLRGLPFVADGGSFTLVTGVLAREPIRSGVVASTVNGAMERVRQIGGRDPHRPRPRLCGQVGKDKLRVEAA